MTSDLDTPVHIRPYSKRNGITLTLVGSLLALVGLVLFLLSKALFAQGLLCFCLGVLALVLGIAKMAEPEASLSLYRDKLIFRHRKGQVEIPWQQIQRVDQVRVHQGIELVELPYIGFKLKDITPLLESISPRLATGLLTEQRPLMMTAAAQNEDLEELEAYLGAEFNPLTVNERLYTGVLAMFGHRSLMLGQHLGYHFYIANDSLDRTPQEAVILLRSYCYQES